MGVVTSTFASLFGGASDERLGRPYRVLMLGLDNAGKTTVLEGMKVGKPVTSTLPTVGFNVESITFKNFTFTLWDVGGQHMIRPLWRHYFQHTDALIYVVDAADKERVDEAREELEAILSSKELDNAVLLVLANKQDMKQAIPTGELAEMMDLQSQRKKRQWYIQGTIATKGIGLFDGMNWMVDAIKANPKIMKKKIH